MHEAGDFEAWWREARGDRLSDPAVAPLARAAHAALTAAEADLGRLRASLEDLLAHLAGPGRTGENCRAVDAFLCLLTAEHPALIDRLPPGWRDVVDDLGLDLGVSLDDPEGAARAGTSPERLLERVRALAVGDWRKHDRM